MFGNINLWYNLSGVDTKMRFSIEPYPGDSGFSQWHDAMRMVSRLPGGIPQEFRKKVNNLNTQIINAFSQFKTFTSDFNWKIIFQIFSIFFFLSNSYFFK
jgi:hypothetical protein